MDELDALREIRAGQPQVSPKVKDRNRLLLRQEIELRSSDSKDSWLRAPRGVAAMLSGLVLLAGIAFSPAGSALADHLGDLIGRDRDEAAISRANEQLREVSGANFPGVSREERRRLTTEQMLGIANNAAEAAGGGEVILPEGVDVRVSPRPLDGIDPDVYANFCERVAVTHPNDQSCQINYMAQSGELPPGDYTQEEIDRILEASN